MMFERSKSRSGIIVSALAVLLAVTSCGEPRATAPQASASRSQNTSPTLIECPTNQTSSTSGLVGLLGGIVQLGATGITIPDGALLAPTLIQVTVPASRFMEIDVSAVGFTSFLFQQPVTITIDYSRCNRNDLDPQKLQVWHIDPLTHQMLENMGGVVDPVTQQITFTTGHLSGYAVAN